MNFMFLVEFSVISCSFGDLVMLTWLFLENCCMPDFFDERYTLVVFIFLFFKYVCQVDRWNEQRENGAFPGPL
jgi:hypothetical protein